MDGNDLSESMHLKLYRTLGENMPSGSREFRDFRHHVPLSRRDKENNRDSMEDLLECWERRGGIGRGNYDELVRIMEEANLRGMVVMIKPQIDEIRRQLDTRSNVHVDTARHDPDPPSKQSPGEQRAKYEHMSTKNRAELQLPNLPSGSRKTVTGEYQVKLRVNFGALTDSATGFRTDDVIDYLYQEYAVSDDQKQETLAERTTRKQAVRLIDYLMENGEGACRSFYEALKKTYPHFAELLDETPHDASN